MIDAHIAAPQPGISRVGGRSLVAMQVETEGGCTPCSRVGKLCAQRWLTILGMLLLVLSSFSAGAETNAKNVLVVFSALVRQHETLDLMESSVRAHFSRSE